MRIHRIVPALPLALLTACGAGPQPADDAASTEFADADAALIAEAMSAAPYAIARDAAIMAYPDEPGGEMRLLREGTNGWVCFPSTPEALVVVEGEDPMCLDADWQEWADAWVNRREPDLPTGLGIAYMLRGDVGASNVDPFATGPTPDNEWVHTGPHIMLIVSDLSLLAGISSDPATGGPYVMWRDTPYAHVMIPVEH